MGACIKNAVYGAVMAEKNVIHTQLDFTKSAQRLAKEILCVYLPEKDVMVEPDEVKNAPYSTKMHILKVHMAKYYRKGQDPTIFAELRGISRVCTGLIRN